MSLFVLSIAWTAAGVLILAGLAGSLVPALPGPPLVFAGAVVFSLVTGFGSVGWISLLVLGLLAAVSLLLDYLASAYGAKRFGGSKWGMWGSVVGGMVGMLVASLPGLVVGLFAGAVLMELWKGDKTALPSLKVGWGSLLGFLGGTLMKLVFSLLMAGLFLYDALR